MKKEYPELEGTINLCNDMINKKKTAVEFLNERFTYIKWMRDRDEISSETGLKWYNEALEKAKQMEKDQIIDAAKWGYLHCPPEQYYNETYKSEQ